MTYLEIPENKNPGAPMLNLGCGKVHHPAWVNLDFVKMDDVIQYDLTTGVPFQTNSFAVVYHSHVLEHFSEAQGRFFLSECFRVLKPGGILRVAVPDLETIARNYLSFLEAGLRGDEEAREKYYFTRLELFDQMTRNTPGGNYHHFISNASESTRKFARQRLGAELDAIFATPEKTDSGFLQKLKRRPLSVYTDAIKHRLLGIGATILGGSRLRNAVEAGVFRSRGEVHLTMYDRFSLRETLLACGFTQVRSVGATESKVEGFASYNLDTRDEAARKPDSLFMEAQKP